MWTDISGGAKCTPRNRVVVLAASTLPTEGPQNCHQVFGGKDFIRYATGALEFLFDLESGRSGEEWDLVKNGGGGGKYAAKLSLARKHRQRRWRRAEDRSRPDTR